MGRDIVKVVLLLAVIFAFGLVVMYSHFLPSLSASHYLSCKYESSQRVFQHSILHSNNNTFRQSSPVLSNEIQFSSQVSTPPQQSDHGYVLTLFYSGQQAAGVNALISQQCWLGSFGLPMYIVEPYIKNSTLHSSSEPNHVNSLRFSDYFNVSAYNTVAKSMGYAQLASWEDFIQNAPRNVTLIDYDVGGGKAKKSPPHMTITVIGEKVQFLARSGFYITKVVSIGHVNRSTHVFNDTEMRNFIFGSSSGPNNVTLVFKTWRGPWYIPNPELDDPNICRHSFTSGLRKHLYQSHHLVELAEHYEEMFLKPRNSLAVMLRTEHVINKLAILEKRHNIQNVNTRGKYNKCMEEVIATAYHLQKGLGTESVFVTADFGKYGSGSWDMPLFTKTLESIGREHVLNFAKETVSTLYRHKMTFEQWEDTFSQATGGIEDRGYIAALQRTIASRADCLVLVGGGNFLKLAWEEYVHNHPNRTTQCLRFICFK